MNVSLFPLFAAISFVGLGALLLHFRGERGRMEQWLLAFLATMAGVSLLITAISMLPEKIWLRQLATYGCALGMGCLVLLTLAFGRWEERPAPKYLLGGWVLLIVCLDLFAGDVIVSDATLEQVLLFPRFGLGGIVFLIVWLLLAIGLLVLSLYGSARAQLPLHANRLLYWAGALTLVLVGQVLAALVEMPFPPIGAVLQMLGAVALLYGIASYQLFDVRGVAREVLGHLCAAILAAVFFFAAIVVARVLGAQGAIKQNAPLLVGIALLMGALYQPGRQWGDRFINRFIIHRGYDPAVIVETYARAIGNILDIETLSTVAIGTINEMLETQRGGVMLVTEREREVVVQPLLGMGRISTTPMTFALKSPILAHFEKRQPLLQYHIDLLPEFRAVSDEQRQWLATLQMDVYVPIATEGVPIGLLALGPKGSGAPYRPDELQLLQTLAGQTVVALTNARLFDDMRKLNQEIQLLNQDLRTSNERLQHMDQVKGDFITIASHELRTPLTQIKGYADILDAMAEENVLTAAESRRLLGNISKATDQLENVIGAMLDVSQIDVDAMSLNLLENRLESVLRIAIEPLASAMRERKQTLTVRGFRNLPPVMSDFQRLVQALSNLAFNAVKYTPDGGRITISAEVLRDEQGGDEQEIELVFADTGVGVDPRDHELIFEKFFRAADPSLHSSGNTKFMGAGPGLGLSIVRGVIQAHGGRIWVESEAHDPVGCPGSAFHLVLPIAGPAGVN